MPWTGRPYKLALARGTQSTVRHWHFVFALGGVAAVFMAFFLLQAGMILRSTAFNWDLRTLGVA